MTSFMLEVQSTTLIWQSWATTCKLHSMWNLNQGLSCVWCVCEYKPNKKMHFQTSSLKCKFISFQAALKTPQTAALWSVSSESTNSPRTMLTLFLPQDYCSVIMFPKLLWFLCFLCRYTNIANDRTEHFFSPVMELLPPAILTPLFVLLTAIMDTTTTWGNEPLLSVETLEKITVKLQLFHYNLNGGVSVWQQSSQ